MITEVPGCVKSHTRGRRVVKDVFMREGILVHIL